MRMDPYELEMGKVSMGRIETLGLDRVDAELGRRDPRRDVRVRPGIDIRIQPERHSGFPSIGGGKLV